MISRFATTYARYRASQSIRRFTGGAAWSIFGSVVSSGMTLITLMLVARILGKDEYGQVVVIQSTLGTVGVFAGFGIGAAATRYVAELRASNLIRLGHILALAERTVLTFGVLATIGLAIFAGWLATNILNAPGLGMPLAISAGAIFFTALDSYQKSILIGLESMRAFAIGTVFGVAVGAPIFLLAVHYFGLEGAAGAIVFNSFIQACISRFQVVRQGKKYGISGKAKGCLTEWRVLWHFAFPALLAGALVGPAHWIAQAFLANTPNGYAELAVLGIAMQWFNVIMFIPATAGRVVLPILTDHVSQNNQKGSRNILLSAMGANAIVAIPMVAIVCSLSSRIMSFYGNGFEQDNTPLILAVIAAGIVAIQSPVGNLLAASSRMWLGVLMNAGWASIYLGVAYFQAYNGAAGIMISLAIAYIAHAIWTAIFSLNELNK